MECPGVGGGGWRCMQCPGEGELEMCAVPLVELLSIMNKAQP